MHGETAAKILQQLDQLHEFEREPVGKDQLQPGRYFAAVYSGEHVAATEFVIGVLFVQWGAGALDVLVGLLIGNLLAVGSWAFLCAPIAVQTRLTLYWYLRRIAGPVVMILFNVLNAVLQCILAGCMITVSASAIRLALGIGPETHWYPRHLSFVLLVLVVGAAVVTLAILGFRRLAQFATVCVPWMVAMFLAGALATLPALGTPRSFSEFWQIAQTRIWTGNAGGGASGIGFWHVLAFAWICNLAMHVGLSDMALFRFARKWQYGFYSAFGMYIGHYLSWICAGIMGAAAALAFREPLQSFDSGGIAYYALGASGALAVVIAGWTTANPTLYRAGLALQAVTPNWPRWTVTLITGALTTAIACFPFVFTRLLEFVGLYGLLLMPIGAIVVVEHWIFPRIGFAQYWAARKRLMLNWPALAAWAIALAVAWLLYAADWLHLFFLALPTWLLTAGLYIALAAKAGARENLPPLPEELGVPRVACPPVLPSTGGQAASGTRCGKPRFEPTPLHNIVYYASGMMALFCLILSVLLPLFVLVVGYASAEAHRAAHAALPWFLNVATLLYFVSGVTWFSQRERRKASTTG